MKHFIGIFLALVTASAGHTVLVSGTVNDSAGDPIDGMRVEIWREAAPFDERLDVVYTENGAFSSDAAEPGHDVYARAKWEFAMVPSMLFNGRVVRIVDMGPGVPSNGTTNFLEKMTDTFADISEDGTVFDIHMNQNGPPALDMLVSRILETLNFVRINLASGPDVSWVVNYDIPVHIRTDTTAQFSPGSGAVFLPTVAYNGLGTAFDQGTLFHEIAHLIHYRHNGNARPPIEPGCAMHTIISEEDPGCAVVEGYANYIAQLVAENHAPDPIIAPHRSAYRDDGSGLDFPARTLWRGDEGGIFFPSPLHTGRQHGPSQQQDGPFESGEDVEGAFAGFLFSVGDAFSFDTSFVAMHNHRPDTPLDFAKALVADMGAGTPAASEIYRLMQSHGMVYSRAKFEKGNPFVDFGEPPNQAPQATNNRKRIRHLTFLRGILEARVTAAQPTDLGVHRVIPLSEVMIGFKPATFGSGETADLFERFTEPVPFAFHHAEVLLDTRAFHPPTRGDGRWDLIAVGKNEDGFVDNFKPSWLGDGNLSVNTDERYLKLLGAWLDGDGNYATENDGMVMIDNTAPVVTEFIPQ